MSTFGYKPLAKLEEEPLWKAANEVTTYMYSLLADFPEEEKWNTESKIRNEANNLLYYIALGIGNAGPNNTEYDWGFARRSVSGLKTMYLFAAKQNFIELEPSQMVKINTLLISIESEVKQAYERTRTYNQNELDEVREKARLIKEARI